MRLLPSFSSQGSSIRSMPSTPLATVVSAVLLVTSTVVRALPYDEVLVKWNLNINQTAGSNVVDYASERGSERNTTYTPSPSNWRAQPVRSVAASSNIFASCLVDFSHASIIFTYTFMIAWCRSSFTTSCSTSLPSVLVPFCSPLVWPRASLRAFPSSGRAPVCARPCSTRNMAVHSN